MSLRLHPQVDIYCVPRRGPAGRCVECSKTDRQRLHRACVILVSMQLTQIPCTHHEFGWMLAMTCIYMCIQQFGFLTATHFMNTDMFGAPMLVHARAELHAQEMVWYITMQEIYHQMSA